MIFTTLEDSRVRVGGREVVNNGRGASETQQLIGTVIGGVAMGNETFNPLITNYFKNI